MHSYSFGYATCELMSIVFGTPFVCAHTYAHFYIPHLATVIRPISLAKLHQATISNSILFTEYPPTREIERGRQREREKKHLLSFEMSMEFFGESCISVLRGKTNYAYTEYRSKHMCFIFAAIIFHMQKHTNTHRVSKYIC